MRQLRLLRLLRSTALFRTTKPDRLNYDISGDDDSIEESSRIPRKKGPRVDNRFPLPPFGVLNHLYIDWVIDKVTMDEYMPIRPNA